MKSPVLETRHHEIKSYKREKPKLKTIQKQRNKIDYLVIKISGKYRLFLHSIALLTHATLTRKSNSSQTSYFVKIMRLCIKIQTL